MDVLTDFETAVLEGALSGDDPLLRALRGQVAFVKASRRQMTGVGFFTDLVVDGSVAPVAEPRDFSISDVSVTVHGLAHGAGAVVFVRSGYLWVIEAFTYDEPWPPDTRHFEVFVPEPRGPLIFAGDVGP